MKNIFNEQTYNILSRLSNELIGKIIRSMFEYYLNNKEPEDFEVIPYFNTLVNVKQKRFIPPTIEDIKKYIEMKKLNVDAFKFYHHYNANGWMVGRVKMKKWESAVCKWHRDSKMFRDNKTYTNTIC